MVDGRWAAVDGGLVRRAAADVVGRGDRRTRERERDKFHNGFIKNRPVKIYNP